MEIITPITVAGIRPFIGRPVCAVLQDGSHVYGYVGGIHDGHLHLYPTADGIGRIAGGKKNKAALRSHGKAQTSAFFRPFGLAASIALPLVLLTLLFALPFAFFI